MKSATPSKLAFFIAVLVSVLSIAVIRLIYRSDPEFAGRLGLIPTLIIFLVSFICSLVIIQFFIYRRVKQVYFNFLKLRTKKENTSHQGNDFSLPHFGDDVLSELNEEVQAWGLERKNEIEQLRKLELYRKEFLGNVSHELKTPIFNIQGYILTLLDGGLYDTSINKEYLSRAEKSVDRMINMIEDLEAISQLETGDLELEFERFDVSNMVKEIFESQELKATNKGIILTLKIPDNQPVYVYADRFRIRQVLTNLIVNSIKYGKEFGETEVKFSNMGENILVTVSDNGIGIGEEHIPRLFERFYRADKSRSREQGGTGLGLAIVKHIIEAHKQTINVTSAVGIGSSFSFTLKKG